MNPLVPIVFILGATPQDPALSEQPQSAAAIIARHERALAQDLAAYISRHPDGADRELACATLFQSVIKNDWFDDYQDTAASYLADSPHGGARPLAQVVVVMARARARKLDDALAAFENLARDLDPSEQRDFMVSFADQFAAIALSAGDQSTATRVYQTLAKRLEHDTEALDTVRTNLARLETIGRSAPPTIAQTIDHQTIRLADFKGKHVLVVFWATYCESLETEFPKFRKLRDSLSPGAFEIVAISLDDEASTTQSYARQHHLPWPQLHASTCGADLVEAFHIRKIPASTLVDPDGRIIALDPSAEDLARILTPPNSEAPAPR